MEIQYKMLLQEKLQRKKDFDFRGIYFTDKLVCNDKKDCVKRELALF